MSKALAVIVLVGWVYVSSCRSGNYSFRGKVKNIEVGKDGYTATIVNELGDSVRAVISRNDMGWRYESVKVNEQIKVFGDSERLGNEVSIKVLKINY